MISRSSLSIRPQADLVQQSLAADGAIACFSSNLFPLRLNADRAPQLKAVVGQRSNLMETNVELNERAQSLMQDEQWLAAIDVIRSQKSHEADGELSWNLGWAYFKLGDYASAELHLKRATQLTPKRAAAWWALGTAQREHGLLD